MPTRWRFRPSCAIRCPTRWRATSVLGHVGQPARAGERCSSRSVMIRRRRWPLKFDVRGRLAGGRIDDPRLPHALTDIAGRGPREQRRLDRHRPGGPQRAERCSAFRRAGGRALSRAVRCRWRPRSASWTWTPRCWTSCRLPCKTSGTSICPPARWTPTCGLTFDGHAWRPEVTSCGA